MPISIERNVGPLLDQKLPELLERFPDHISTIVELAREFHERYDSQVLGEMQEGTFCEVIKAWIDSKNLDPALKEALDIQRLRIFTELMRTMRQEFTRQSSDDISRPSNSECRNGSSAPKRTNEQISTVVTQYAQLAVYLGDSVALDILQTLGILRPGERSDALSAISRYLGECAPPGGEEGTVIVVLQSEEAILQNMTVYEKMERSLTAFCYRRLVNEGADTLENQPRYLANIDELVSTQLDDLYERAFGKASKKVSKTHKDLYDGVVDHFKAAAALKIPDTMAKTTTDHNGTEWPLGSWRQRLALADMLNPHKRHVYIGFGAGEGKTFTHQWGFELAKQEHIRHKRLGRPRKLCIAPKAVLNEIPNRVRRGSAPKQAHSLYYPDPEQAPTVGVIRAGMSLDQIREAASKDDVYCAYSMWNVSRNDRSSGSQTPEQVAIADLLINQEEPFTSFSVDESHLLQGGKVYTHLARRTIQEIPGLYDSGHIMFSSATPAPGHLSGLRTTAELLEPPRADVQEGERHDSPPRHWAELRRMMGKLWMMDPQADWMRHVERREYSLTSRELECLQLIVDDNTMPSHQKLYLSQLIIRCPKLMSGDSTMPWSSFEETTRNLSELLHGDNRSTVLVAENMLSNRVLQQDKDPEEHALNNPEEYFFQALETWCWDQGITFHVIHGDTPEDHRIAIYEDMQNAKNEQRKCVLYAHSACLNLGIDLRFIEGIVSQQWPYNTPDLYQLLSRAIRMGNTGCRVIVSSARDTVEEGILTSAELKYLDVLRCLYGVILSDQRMEELGHKRGADADDENIARKIESSEEKSRRFSRALHGVGAAKTKDFWNLHLNDFLEMLTQKNEMSMGDGQRVLASMVLDMEKSGMLPENGCYLHANSEGQRLTHVLATASPEKYRSIRSMDATKDMLDFGGVDLPGHIDQSQNIVDTPDALNHLVSQGVIQAESQDLVVLQGFEQTSHAVQQNGDLQFTGRVRALLGAVRALKTPDASSDPPSDGGVLIIPLGRDACTEVQMRQLRNELYAFGLDIVESHTGVVSSKDNEGEPPFEMYVITTRKAFQPTQQDFEAVPPERLTLTPIQGKEARTRKSNRKLPFTLPHQDFRIGRKQLKHTMPVVNREAKLQYLQRLTEIIGVIHSMAQSSDEMIDLLKKKRAQKTLKDLGIVCFPHFSKEGQKGSKKKKASSVEAMNERRLAFRFLDSPHLFYPYDSQWQKGGQE